MNQNTRREKHKESREIISFSELDDSDDGEYHESTKMNDKVSMKKPRINEETG